MRPCSKAFRLPLPRPFQATEDPGTQVPRGSRVQMGRLRSRGKEHVQVISSHGQGTQKAHPHPLPHVPQPTHPRTLQSLEGDRSRERELGDWAEPCPSPSTAPQPVHSPSPLGCLCCPLDPVCNKSWPSERRLRLFPDGQTGSDALGHRDNPAQQSFWAAPCTYQASRRSQDSEGPDDAFISLKQREKPVCPQGLGNRVTETGGQRAA